MITHKIVSKEKWPLFRPISYQLALIFSGDVCALHIPGSSRYLPESGSWNIM